MKYKDLDGQWKNISVKVADTLPIGTEVEYDGTEVPNGWEQVEDIIIDTLDGMEDNKAPTVKAVGERLYKTYNFHHNSVYLENITYYHLASIVVSETSSSNRALIGLKGMIGGFGSGTAVLFDFMIGSRGGLFYKGNRHGNPSERCDIVIYKTDSVTYDIYYMGNGYQSEATIDIKLMQHGCVIGNFTETTPQGTQVVSLSNIPYIENYSTNDTRIGTWYNGKPLYRKVVEFTTTATDTQQIPLGVENGYIRGFEGYIYYAPDDAYVPLNYPNYGAEHAWNVAWFHPNSVHIKVGTTFQNRSAYVIILYTKTTD